MKWTSLVCKAVVKVSEREICTGNAVGIVITIKLNGVLERTTLDNSCVCIKHF